jgi:hypothetical protein
MNAKGIDMLDNPARVHVQANPDLRVEQIRRYMKRHPSTTFINPFGEGCTTVEFKSFAELAGLSRAEIRAGFNAAREKGYNQ